jgi:hypothetical protein
LRLITSSNLVDCVTDRRAEAIRVGSLRARVGHGYQLLRLTLERKSLSAPKSCPRL